MLRYYRIVEIEVENAAASGLSVKLTVTCKTIIGDYVFIEHINH